MEALQIKVPEVSGVYTFWKAKTPIYIGKAINLKARVSSYFNLHLLPKTRRMVEEAERLTFQKVDSEFEALLLEASLIRKYQPRYNSASKDDKHPLYITITKDNLPRVITTRREGSFGPFPSSKAVKQVLKMIRRIIPYSDHKVGKRACIYSQIGLCDPCPSTIATPEEKRRFLKNVRRVRAILNGRVTYVKLNLEAEMKHLAQRSLFEEAMDIREKLKNLEYITSPRTNIDSYLVNPNLMEDIREKELISLKKVLRANGIKVKSLKRVECYDVSHLGGTYPTASMVVFTNGQENKSQYRHFRIRQKKSQSDYDSIREIAKRRKRQIWERPDLIVIDGGIGQVKAFESDIPVVGIAKNPDRLIIGTEKIRLEKDSLSFVQRLRDEAHRFARRYHHHLISKTIIG